MKQWNQDQIFKGLQKLVTEINYLEKLDDGSIWTSGEDACIFKGLPPFNHNLEYGEILLTDNGDTNPNHKGMKVKEMYFYGIHREIFSWLEEIPFVLITKGFAIKRLEFDIEENDGYRINAKAFGETLDIKKHNFKVEIKAPTFYDMEIRQDNDGVYMRFLLDL